MSITITVTLTDDEAIGLGQLVNGEMFAWGKAARELVQPEEPMEEAAVEAMLRAQAKVLGALEDAGVKIKPPP
jgi:hypothetical protein